MYTCFDIFCDFYPLQSRVLYSFHGQAQLVKRGLCQNRPSLLFQYTDILLLAGDHPQEYCESGGSGRQFCSYDLIHDRKLKG
jgi:hypothetical protein